MRWRVRECSLAYPACDAYAPHCDVMCGSSGSTIFFRHYLINGTISGKKHLLNIKCVFRFSLQILSKTFLILRRIDRYIVINVKMSAVKYSLYLSGFN